MKKYKFTVEIEVEAEALTSSDARTLIDDLFGVEEMEGFGVKINSLEIKQELTQ